VRRPLHQQAGPPPVMPRPPGGLLATLTGRRSSGGGAGGAATEGIRESGLKAANELANSDLRAAMLAVREDGLTAKPANVRRAFKSLSVLPRACECLASKNIALAFITPPLAPTSLSSSCSKRRSQGREWLRARRGIPKHRKEATTTDPAEAPWLSCEAHWRQRVARERGVSERSPL